MMAGQTISDRLLAARHSLAGQGLAKSVCKATTEEMISPKKKHLDCKFFDFSNNIKIKESLKKKHFHCTILAPYQIFSYFHV